MVEAVSARPASRPTSCGQLFWVFTRLALQGFGGVLPVAQRELVERTRWMQRSEFLEMLALAQVLPGPNVINLALMTGQRYFGWRGAISAAAGMLTAPLVVVLALAALASQWRDSPLVAGALRGMAIVSAGLIAGTALKLAFALRQSELGWPMAIVFVGLTFAAVALLRWPLVGAVLALGALACAWAAWRLRA